MRFLVPEPEIDIYNEGFGGKDLLQRAPFGKKLSAVLESIEDPIVLAIDGSWGSGKSFFLQAWVGAHTIENGGAAKTVYFDAYANDFLEEPLISLTSALSERFKNESQKPAPLDKMREAVAKFGVPVARFGLAVMTAGLSEYGGAVVDAALQSGNAEVTRQIEAFWQKEEGKRSAMIEFKSALIDLTLSSKSSSDPQKLIIVIDELDRCRPDYALSILETIKHFFSVPNVHFVLGLNLSEFRHIVSARYGRDISSNLYLEKFISITCHLPDRLGDRWTSVSTAIAYFDKLTPKMGHDSDHADTVRSYLQMKGLSENQSIRNIQKVLSLMSVVRLPKDQYTKENHFGYKHLVSGLMILKFMRADLYQKARNGTITMNDVEKGFGLEMHSSDERYALQSTEIDAVWRSCIHPDSLNDEQKRYRIWDRSGGSIWTIQKASSDYVEFLRLTD